MGTSSKAHISFHKFGDWEGVIRAFSQLDHNIHHSVKYGMRKAAKRVKDNVIDAIQTGDWPYTPLNPKTIKRKGHGLALYHTGHIVQFIRVFERHKVVSVGVKRGFRYPDGNEVSNVAAMNEFGTKNIPARPVWGYTISVMGGPSGIRAIVADVLVKRINRSLAGTPLRVTRHQILNKY